MSTKEHVLFKHPHSRARYTMATRFIMGTVCEAMAKRTVESAAQSALAHIQNRSSGGPRKLSEIVMILVSNMMTYRDDGRTHAFLVPVERRVPIHTVHMRPDWIASKSISFMRESALSLASTSPSRLMTEKSACEMTASLTADTGVLRASHCLHTGSGLSSSASASETAVSLAANAPSPPMYRLVTFLLDRRL